MTRMLKWRRLTAIVLTLVLFVIPLGDASVSVTAADETVPVLCEGEEVSCVTLPEDGKLCLQAATSAKTAAACRWQIRDPQSEDHWINIYGAHTCDLFVTYALVGSMLGADHSALLRCQMTVGDEVTYTDEVRVTMAYNPTQDPVITAPDAIPQKRMLRAARPASDGEGEHITHSIVINYLFDNNTLAFEPYGATVADGSDFIHTIESPVVVGYQPFRRVGEDYVKADEVVLDYRNIKADIVINVVYEPALVDFSVHHHLQNLLDDEYSIEPNHITNERGVTGSQVGDGLAMTEEELPGFRALAYEKQLPVAADGTTVVEIRYDRNYYLVNFDMDGGYGTEPVYTRYGATVGANRPTRHGYAFGGWILESYDGRTPTAEEIAQYAMADGGVISVPAANLRYRARWITQKTNYTMVFWKENANDDGYSYWGYLDELSAMSGSRVNAQDLISQVPGIDDEDCFVFNSAMSDKNVLVEGDGTTVVNVYYNRKMYGITVKAPGLCKIPENHTHGDACYRILCDLEHTHGEDCLPYLFCTKEEHTVHTDACYVCGLEPHSHGDEKCGCTLRAHTHSNACWTGVGTRVNRVTGAPSSPKNGQVYYRSRKYYIYLNGSWYNYTSSGAGSGDIVQPSCGYTVEHTHGSSCNCDLPEHAHSNVCYGCELHTHNDDCMAYTCGMEEHTHTSACRQLVCGIPVDHDHDYACNSSSSTSTVRIIYRKYEQTLEDVWPIKDLNDKVYDSGQRWTPSESTYYKNVLVYISKMPADDFTLTLSTANYDPYTMNYYLQTLPDEPSDTTKDGKGYVLNHTIVANYNYITYAEDFFEISGYVRYDSDPNFSNNQIDMNGGGTVNFYYDRSVDNPLIFSNNGIITDSQNVNEVPFGMPLAGYYFEPSYPTNLEPNAYTFAGWYTSPGCFDGTEMDWENATMEEGGMQLYAKWVPITHRVRVFKDADCDEQIGEDQIVDHKAFATAPNAAIENGNYVFQGWFYKDLDGTEKAFVFNGIPILKDMDIYAKWSSHVAVTYRVNYVLQKDGTPIADPIEGSAIAGHNKTFEAKAGADLYEAYRVGYYPVVNSHTITMGVDGVREFTFEYVFVESMPYKVQYLDAVTGEERLPSKIVEDNSLSVVTEVFARVDGMMPDAYQKRLVLVGKGADSDGDKVLDENVITFYYHTDEVKAYYRVMHYVRNISGNDYREYRSEETVGIIGDTFDVEALTLTGFTFDGAKTKINGTVTPVDGNTVNATLPPEGMLIELYYERNTVPYVVHYLDSVTREAVYPSKTGSGVFGAQIPEHAPNLTALGYDSVGEQVRLLTLSANPEHNVFEFFYQEQIVSLKYQIVGPAGCGTLNFLSENVKAITGTSTGSTPTIATGFRFIGWYTDAACTVPVDAALVDPATNRIVPVKTGAIWQTATYYAKVVALKTDLTIRTQSADSNDAPQMFLFRIVGKSAETAHIDLTVSVGDNGATTIAALPTGDYTITELTAWSWRYGGSQPARNLSLEYNAAGNTIVYDKTRTNVKWLDGNAVSTNHFLRAE